MTLLLGKKEKRLEGGAFMSFSGTSERAEHKIF